MNKVLELESQLDHFLFKLKLNFISAFFKKMNLSAKQSSQKENASVDIYKYTCHFKGIEKMDKNTQSFSSRKREQ